MLLALLFSLNAYAALDCPALKARLDDLNPTRREWKMVEIPAAQIDASLAALKAPHAPSPAELKRRLGEIRKNPEKSFPAYLDDNYANCTMRRAELRSALVHTAARLDPSSPVRKKIAKAVLATVENERKFPTLISAIADARVLEHGAASGLWPASEKQKKAIQALHEKIKEELAEENQTYGEPWGAVTEGLKKAATPEEKEKFLRESEAWKKVRAHVLAEPEESARHLKELRKLAKALR